MMAIFTAWLLHEGGSSARSVALTSCLAGRNGTSREPGACPLNVSTAIVAGPARQTGLSGKPEPLASRDAPVGRPGGRRSVAGDDEWRMTDGGPSRHREADK